MTPIYRSSLYELAWEVELKLISELCELFWGRSPQLKHISGVRMLQGHMTRVEREVTSTHRTGEQVERTLTSILEVAHYRGAKRAHMRPNLMESSSVKLTSHEGRVLSALINHLIARDRALRSSIVCR